MGRVDNPRYTKLLLKKATRRGLTPKEERELRELSVAKANAELQSVLAVILEAQAAGHEFTTAGLRGRFCLRSYHKLVIRGGQLYVINSGVNSRWIPVDQAVGLAQEARRLLKKGLPSSQD